MADRVANLLAFGSLAPENPPRDGLAQMQIPSWYNSGTSFGTLAPPAPFPAANSVDWLQQRLPKALGDWLGNAYAEGEQRANDLSPRTVAGEAITGAMNLMPAGRMAVPRQGIRAYHGSPHDFDRFDMSRIGTGEGAQAYGHGLYFAENPKTATAYRNTLAEPKISVTDSRGVSYDPLTHKDGGVRDAAGFLAESGGDINHAISEWRAFNAKYPNEDRIMRAGSVLNGWKDRGFDFSPGGKMYEVNINAKPEQFLDWDRPLGQQPEILQKLRSNPLTEKAAAFERPTGAEFYENRLFMPDQARPAASAALRDAGIPGIRYLDQGSRNFSMMKPEPHEFLNGTQGWRVNGPKGDMTFDTHGEASNYIKSLDRGQTSNYVLFNDSIIDILKKWGLMGGMAGAGAAATSDQSQAQPFGSLAP